MPTPSVYSRVATERDELREKADRYEEALTRIRDTLPEQQDAYARLVFATAANALEPEMSN